MAVASVQEFPGRRWRFTDKYERMGPRIFCVRTTANTDGPGVVGTAVDPVTAVAIPAMWDPHPDDSDALVSSIELEEVRGHRRVWLVTVNYSTQATDESLQAVDPVDEPAQFSQDTERVEVAMQKDLDGLDIKNSAGDPYDPPPTQEVGILVIQYSDNLAEADTHYADSLNYLYHTNNGTFWGRDEKTVLCSKFRLTRQFRNDVAYQRRELEFKLLSSADVARVGDWTQLVLLDAGYRISVDNAGNSLTRPIPAGNAGETTSRPSLLNGGGGNLALGGSPVYRSFRIRDTVDFGTLGTTTPPM